MTEATNTLEQALDYNQRQLSVISLISKSKKPSLPKWEKYQTVIANEHELKEMFPGSESNYNNVGIITGRVSKILAIDIDGEEAHARFQTKIEEIQDIDILNAVNSTMKIKTGTGNINIVIGFNPDEFANNKHEIKNRILWKGNAFGHSEIRIKGEGGYIVAPPSIHPNGNRYELINGLEIVTLSKNQIQEIFDACSRKDIYNNTGKDQRQNSLDDETISDIVNILKPYCQKGIRNNFVMCFSGWLRKENATLEVASKIIDGLTDDDEEKQGRFTTLEATYNKTDLDDVNGYSGLLTIISNLTSDEEAVQILNRVEELAFPNNLYNYKLEEGGRNKSQSKKLIELAESNTELFFKDQYDIPYAKVKVGNHHEIFPIKSRKFEHYITKLCFDQSNGQQIPTQEVLNNSIRVLHAKTEFGDQKRTIHLRSAWGPNGEICYDLTDEKWRQIKISKDRWQILKSVDSELLFTRFNQVAQLDPDRDYPPDIFDKYLNLMNISDPQHRLLLKVITICSFIPNIPHPICIPYGEQGSCKSTFCEFQKRLIDPSKINLLTVPKDKSEFVQQLHHHYLVAYDNVSYLPPWFSDEVCKAVTGVGNSKRKLYSDDEDVIINYKRCIIINGINNYLTEPDALDRSILIELERIKSKSCCKDDQHARIPYEISNMFNSDSDSDGRENKNYWICKRKKGIFPKKLSLFKDERIRQKQSGNTVKQLALKILINGGYGVFGNRFFKYYDPRVAELITAYGRYTLTKMQEIAEEMGLNVVYGDTDSLFIDIRVNNYEECNNENAGSRTITQVKNNIITKQVLKFKEDCNRRLGIEVEHSKTYKTAIISSKKEHYIGWTGIPETAPDIVGMEGDKNDRPRWINKVFRHVVENILGVNESSADPISTIKKSVSDLDLGKVNHELLTRSVRLSKNSEEYNNPKDRKRRLGMAIGARKGDVIEYYESDNNKEGYSLNYRDMSITKYKLMLWKTVKEILEIAGYDISSLENELGFDRKR